MEFLKNKIKEKERRYQRRKLRTNTQSKVNNCGNRLLVNKTNMYMRVQVIGTDGKVVLDINDRKNEGTTKIEKSENLGLQVAKLLGEKGIKQVTFDRNGFLFHGRVKSLAEGLKKGGIKL